MRYGPNDKFWVVTDPHSTESVLADILFEASLVDLGLQFKGGLTTKSNPTLFTEKAEAEVEAKSRLLAAWAAKAIAAQAADGKSPLGARTIVFLDEEDEVLLEIPMPGVD